MPEGGGAAAGVEAARHAARLEGALLAIEASAGFVPLSAAGQLALEQFGEAEGLQRSDVNDGSAGISATSRSAARTV